MKTSQASRSRARFAFLLVFLLMAAGIVITGWLYYRNYQKQFKIGIQRQLYAIADLKAGDLARYRKERLENGSIFSQNAPFAALARRFLEKPEDADAQRQLQTWIGKCQPDYDEVRLLDAQGVTRLSSPAGLPAVSVAVAKGVSDVLRSGQETIQDFYRGEQDQRIHLGVLSPILDEQDAGRPLGVVFLRIDPETYLYPFIKRWPTESATAETLLVRREGNEAVFLNELRFHTNTALKLRLPLDRVTLPAAQAASGHEGFMEGIDYQGRPVVAVLRMIPDSPWALVARMDAEEAFAPMKEQLWQVAVMTGALLISVGGFVGLIWRQQRVRFYREKVKATEAMVESEARFREILEKSPLPLCHVTKEGVIAFRNERFVSVFGYTAAEVPTLTEWWLRAYPDPHYRQWVTETWDAAVRRSAAEGRDIEAVEYNVTCKSGEKRVVEISGIALGEELLATFVDLTERKRTEEVLRASEERFRIAAETANDLVYEWDLKQCVQWSGKIDEMLGYELGEFPRTLDGWAAAVHPEDAERTMAAIHAHLEGRASFAVEYRVRRKDGVYRWWSARGKAARTPDGKPARMIGSVTDITEQKRVAEIQTLLASVVQSSDDAIINGSMDGILLTWNQGAERIYGYTASEVIGKSVAILVPPDQPEEIREVLGKIRRGEHISHYETVRRTKDGRGIDVSLSVAPMRDASGILIGVSTIARDITERRQAEEVLRESEARYRTLVENIPQKIFMKDRNSRWISVNENFARDFGIRPEEIAGKMTSDLFSKELADKYTADDKRVMETGQAEELEERYVEAGRETWVHTTKTPVRDKNGEVIGVFGIFSDITERKQAQERIHQLNSELEQRVIERTAQLEAANKELEAFTYSVSHDLRAPLRAVDGFSQVVLEDYGPQLPEGCRQDLQTIRNGAQKMGKLIDDLLMFSRLNQLPLSKQAVDTGKLVRGVLEELNSQREGRRIELRIADLPPCQADPALLKQVWVNLLSNALKYTGKRESALVEIGCAADNGRNVYFVRDNGTGFDMQYAHKLFGVFQRLHRAEDYEGTGVGLAIVQRVIHRHGGRIWAESALESGATFYFTLEGETKL